MTKRHLIGNAQTIGCREVQSNFFSTAHNDAGDLLAVLADGAIDHRNGRIAAIVSVGCCIEAFTRSFSQIETERSAEFLLDTALKAKRHVQDAVYIGKPPRLSLTMALFRGKEMHYFSVGVNKILLYDGRNERPIGEGSNSPYSAGKLNVPPKSIVGVLSAGAYANAHPMERIKIIESKIKVFDKAQAIIESVGKKGLTIQLNATALLIEVMK